MTALAWIELHQSLWTHRKTLILASQLDVDEVTAAGHMARLWCWALDNAPDGSLANLPNIVIAAGAGWKRDAETFVVGAMTAGYIKDESGVLTLHDWYDYAGRMIEKRQANAERMRAARATNVQRTQRARAGATVPNRTVPNHNQKIKDHVHVDTYTSDFESFWSAYPRPIGKSSAFRAWKARVKEKVDVNSLVQAAVNYSLACEKDGRQTRYIKHPATFLGPDKHYEDYINGVPEISITIAQTRTSHQVKPETQVANADERYANFFKKYPGGAGGGPRNDTG